MKEKKFCIVVLLFLLAVCVRSAFAEVTSDVNNPANWQRIQGFIYNGDKFVMPQYPVPGEDHEGKPVMVWSLAARALNTDNVFNGFAYASLRFTVPSGMLDLSTSCQMRYKYKVEVTGGSIRGPFMRLHDANNGGSNFFQPTTFQSWNTDGGWHQMEMPLQPVDTTHSQGSDWQAQLVMFQMLFYLSVPQMGDQITVKVYLSDFEFVEKSEASPAYLVVYGHGEQNLYTSSPDVQLSEKIKSWGYMAQSAPYDTLSLDLLRQFNVVVLQPNGLSGFSDDTNNILLQYVREGGGLLVLGTWNGVGQNNENNGDYNHLLHDIGIQILSEQVFEDDDSYKADCPLADHDALGWTNNFLEPADSAKKAVLDNVTGFYYPLVYYECWSDYTSPLKIIDNNTWWSVLIYGMDTAYSMITEKNDLESCGSKENGTYPLDSETPSPLLAVREYGDNGSSIKGRIAVLPVVPSCLWTDAYHRMWGGGFMMDSDGPMPGKSLQLLKNIFRYLAEPSKGKFGFCEFDPVTSPAQPISWNDIHMDNATVLPNNYVGLIGAQSNLSVGQNSPEEMIAEAKSAGYDFICFTEELAGMDAGKWAQLKKTCADNSTATFKAYPGYKYQDESGNSWITFSNRLPWFDDTFRSKRTESGYHDRIRQNGTFYYAYDVPIILLTPHDNPEKPWFQGMFHGVSLYTYAGNGSPMDSLPSLDYYGKLNKMMFTVFPVAVHLVKNAAEVTAARNYGYQTNVRWYNPDVINAMNGSGGPNPGTVPTGKARMFYWPTQVSQGFWQENSFEGPLVEDFQVANGYLTDLREPGRDRMRLHIRASAPAGKGLSEVCIYDGDNPRPWRRFLLGEATTFDKSIDFFHDRQYELFAVIKDKDNRTAVSWVVNTHVTDNVFIRCSDNRNILSRGKWSTPPLELANTRGIETYSALREGNLYSGFRSAGGATIEKDFPHPAVASYPVLAGRFGTIMDEIIKDHFPPGEFEGFPNETDNVAVADNNTQLTGRVRHTVFTPWNDSTLIDMVEGEWVNISSSDLSLGDCILWASTRSLSETSKYCVTKSDNGSVIDSIFPSALPSAPTSVIGGLPQYGLVGMYPSVDHGSVGVVALQSGLQYVLTRYSDPNSAILYLRAPNVILKAGVPLKYSYLSVTGNLELNPPDNNTFITGFVDTMGLDGDPAYEISSQTNTSYDYIARLAAVKYGFAGTTTQADLPIDLPVMISGLNPNWDAGIWYEDNNTLTIPITVFTEYGQGYSARKTMPGRDQLIHFPVLPDNDSNDRSGTGMLQVDLNEQGKNRSVYIGNLLVANGEGEYEDSCKDIVLMLTDKYHFTAHNPTDSAISCYVEPGPGFTLLNGFSGTNIQVPAGASQEIIISTPPTTTVPSVIDADGDDIPDGIDNCPNVYNPQQLDADLDKTGDCCDISPGCGGCGQPVCDTFCL